MATFHEHEIAEEIHPEIFTLKQPHLNSRNKAQNAAPRESLLSARRPGTSTFGWVYLWGLGGFCFWWEEKVDVFFCVKRQVDMYIYIYIYIHGIRMIMINIPNRFIFLIWYIISWHVIFYTQSKIIQSSETHHTESSTINQTESNRANQIKNTLIVTWVDVVRLDFWDCNFLLWFSLSFP